MGLTVLEAAVLGAVLAAVSPAVVVPRMVRLMEEGYGKMEGIPQMILAGVSVDDVYVIVLFSTFTGMMQGKGVFCRQLYKYPCFDPSGNRYWTGRRIFAGPVL